MGKDQGAPFKTAMQVFAILLAIGFLSMLLHKALADVSVLAQQHSGSDFWAALARYVLRNLAGGS